MARNADTSMYELVVAAIEPRLQLPIAKAVMGWAHLLLILGATITPSRAAIATLLKAMRSPQTPLNLACKGSCTASSAGAMNRTARILEA